MVRIGKASNAGMMVRMVRIGKASNAGMMVRMVRMVMMIVIEVRRW